MAHRATIDLTPRFRRALAKLDEARAAQALKALRLFMADTRHGKLNFEKVKGTDYATIRMNQGDRIVLKRLHGHHYAVVDLGSHDYTYRKYG